MKHMILVILACLLVVTASSEAADRTTEPPVFLPDLEAETDSELKGSTWVGGREEIQFSLQLIEPAQRLAFITHLTGVAIDPFASPKDEEQRFMSFVLEIRNDNEGQLGLSFLPKSAWLVPNKKKETRTPTGLGELRFSYQVAGKELPAAYERVDPAFFESPVTLYPGDSVAGLLIYKALPANIDSFVLDMSMTLSTGSRIKFTAPYVQPKKKQTKKK
jgi:hypothetical protein